MSEQRTEDVQDVETSSPEPAPEAGTAAEGAGAGGDAEPTALAAGAAQTPGAVTPGTPEGDVPGGDAEAAAVLGDPAEGAGPAMDADDGVDERTDAGASVDGASDGAARDETAPDDAASDLAASGEVASDDASTGDTASDDGASDDASTGDAASDDASTDDGASDDEEAGEGSPARRGGRRAQLEREGEVAADFLENLLDICDLDGDLDVDIDGDRAAVAIVDSDEGRVPRRLVGSDGQVLEALQELTRLAVQSETGERSRLMLDVAGHRAERRASLVTLAKTAIDGVKESGQPASLEPMSAFERKVVHDEVLAAGLHSESDGTEPRRYVVITPA